jgi:hypothetical protein
LITRPYAIRSDGIPGARVKKYKGDEPTGSSPLYYLLQYFFENPSAGISCRAKTRAASRARHIDALLAHDAQDFLLAENGILLLGHEHQAVLADIKRTYIKLTHRLPTGF